MASAPPLATTPPGPGLADRLALLLSVLLSPFLITPLFCCALVAAVAESWADFWKWGSICIFFSTAVPCGYIAYNVRRGRITDLHVRLLEQRTGPFLAGIAGLGLLSLVLLALGGPPLLTRMAVVTFFNSMLFAAITRYWKISIHTAVLGCCLGGGRELLGWSTWWFLLLQPPLIWARAQRKRHHVIQGSAGALLAYGMTAWGLRLLRGSLW
ncbi:MAG: hypothetical protein HY319_01920 [Armatimonadetes bacterium]|nr:hypothetical protein [Armatimonadota bacterium]